MSNEPEAGIENLEQAIALSDVPPKNPGPFKWLPDPYDAELRYGTIYRHFADQDRLINLWNLPASGGVFYASNRDGVLILMARDGDVCFYEGTDVAQKARMLDRYVNDPYTIFIDGVLTEEEYGEVKAELKKVKENVEHRKAVLKRREAVAKLRVELMAEHLGKYQTAKGFLESPDLDPKAIESYGKELLAARKRIAKIEQLGERAVFNRAKKARLQLLELLIKEALKDKPIKPMVAPCGTIIHFEGMSYTSQDELDLILGRSFRLLAAIDACTTPEELVQLEQP